MKLCYLDLSAAHVSSSTMERLRTGSITGATVAEYEYGAFVSVPSEPADIDQLICPEDLKTVLRFARTEGCDVIRLDRDAPVESALPYHEW